MKNIIILYGLIILLSACTKAPTSYKVISHHSNGQAAGLSDQQLILDSQDKVNLKLNHELLIQDMGTSKIFKLIGPASGDLETLLQSNTTQSFAKEYFSFMLENINKNDQEIKQLVYGGVSRGLNDHWKFNNNELIMNTTSISKTDFSSLENFDLEYTIEETAFTNADEIPIAELKTKNKNQELIIHSIVPGNTSELILTIASDSLSRDLNKQKIQLLADKSLPKTNLLDFYLQHRLFREAKRYASNHKINHPFYSKVLKHIRS